MKNQSLKKLALLGVLVASSAQATERRTPWISEHGPIRYLFEKLHEDSWNFEYWSAAHYKEAHKSYAKHSTKTVPYTQLIFNKADFTLNEIFPDSQVPLNSEFYSPYLKLTNVSPRAEYTEVGMTVGGRVDFPVWCNKGRIGLRASVPFRRIEIERTDNCCDTDTDPLAPFKATRVIRVDRNSAKFDVDAASAATIAAAGAGADNAAQNAADAVILGGNTAYTALAGQGGALVALVNNGARQTAAIGAINSAGDPLADTTVSAGPAGPAVMIVSQANTSAEAGARALAGATADASLGRVIAASLPIATGLGNQAAVVTQLGQADAVTAINTAGNRGDLANPRNQIDMVVNAYRLDFVASLPNSQHESAVQPANNVMNIFNNNVAVTVPAQKNRSTVGITKAKNADDLAANGLVAWMTANDNTATKAHVLVSEITQVGQANNALTNVPAAGKVGVFDAAANFAPLGVPQATGARLIEADPTLWLTFRRAADSADPERFARDPLGGPGVGGAIARNIENLARQFNQNPFAFFADDQNFKFETGIRSGMGDIDLDLFYEHNFNDDFIGEVWVGVRFPTGGDKHQAGNPYKPQLGNGGHYEIKIGGLMAWQVACWMNIKVDAMYSFALESDETRCAAFKGATIKNFGPATKADVDWGYAVGHVDFNFFHPCTSKVRSMIGYEIFYKTEDHISFKLKQMQSWLGRQYDPISGDLVPNPKDLDSGLARKNTEAIAHKVRWETSCQINKYFELFAGGSAVFAGQNVPRDRDAHIGYNIRF